MELNPPPWPTQKIIIENLTKDRHEDHSVWEYAISTQWWDSYTKNLQIQSNQMPDIGPVTMDILDMTSEKSQNEYVNQTLWGVLISWYGIDKTHTLRRRHVNASDCVMGYSSGAGVPVLGDRKLDFILLQIKNVNPNTDNRVCPLWFYIWDSVGYLNIQVERAVGKKIENIRLWLSIYKNGEQVAITPLTCDGAKMFAVDIRCILPEMTSLFQKRANEYPTDPVPANGVKRKLLHEAFLQENIEFHIMIEEIHPSVKKVIYDITSDHAEFRDGISYLSSPKDNAIGSQQWESSLSDTLNSLTLSIDSMKTETASRLLAQAKEIVTSRLKEVREMEANVAEQLDAVAERERKLNESEEVVRSKEIDLDSKVSKFKVNLTDYLVRQKSLDGEMRRIESLNSITTSLIRINVGGELYTTSLDTLRREPTSLLGTMFSGKHAVAKDKNGDYFIDRDGILFKYIIAYLRDGDSAVYAVSDVNLLNGLFREAKFFQLTKLEATVKAQLSKSGQVVTQS